MSESGRRARTGSGWLSGGVGRVEVGSGGYEVIWTVSSEDATGKVDQRRGTGRSILEFTRPDLASSIEDLSDPRSVVGQSILQVASPSWVGSGFSFKPPYLDDANRIGSHQCDRCL